MPMDADFYGKIFTGYGALGVLALMLVLTVRTLWNRLTVLADKYDGLQAARIAERDEIVRALTEHTRVMEETTALLAQRRLR